MARIYSHVCTFRLCKKGKNNRAILGSRSDWWLLCGRRMQHWLQWPRMRWSPWCTDTKDSLVILKTTSILFTNQPMPFINWIVRFSTKQLLSDNVYETLAFWRCKWRWSIWKYQHFFLIWHGNSKIVYWGFVLSVHEFSLDGPSPFLARLHSSKAYSRDSRCKFATMDSWCGLQWMDSKANFTIGITFCASE